jgi:hypothetical protein
LELTQNWFYYSHHFSLQKMKPKLFPKPFMV